MNFQSENESLQTTIFNLTQKLNSLKSDEVKMNANIESMKVAKIYLKESIHDISTVYDHVEEEKELNNERHTRLITSIMGAE